MSHRYLHWAIDISIDEMAVILSGPQCVTVPNQYFESGSLFLAEGESAAEDIVALAVQ